MKKKQLIALGAIAVIFFTACSNPFFPEKKETSPENGIIDGAAPKTPIVTLSVHPVNPYILGDEATITANAAVSGGGKLSYQWYSNDEESNEGGVLIPNETGASYAPSTNSAGTVYYYVKATNTLSGKTASTVSGAVKITVYDIGTATAIRNVDVDVTAPVKDGTPATTATTDDSGYTCTAVTWNPAHNPFQGGAVYTVTVTLTAESNHTFIALRTAAINGQIATVTDNDGNTLTLSFTFAPTDTRTVTGIAIASQPSKLTYTHGEPLNLNGLVVRLTFDTAETEDITLANFASKNISTHPANGVTLLHTDHNGQSVAVSYGEKTANTNNLTVNPVSITSAAVTVTGPMKGETPHATAAADGEGYTCGAVSWSPNDNPFKGSTRYTATVTLTADADHTFASTLTAAAINGDNATVTSNTGSTVTLSIQFDETLAKDVIGISIKTQPTKLSPYTHGDTLDLNGLVVTLTFDDGTNEDVPLANFGTNISAHPANHAELHHSTNNNAPVVVSFGELTANTNNLNVAKANPVVTWPTNLTATYGQTLSNILLPGNGTSSPAGTFTWTTPAASVGSVGTQSHSMTFTPTDTANYNTLTQNVNITVANPQVTFNTNGGSAIPSQSIAFGGVVSRPSDPTRSGYVFDFWYEDTELTVPYNFSAVVTGNITLYARWISQADINAMTTKDMVWVAGGSFQMGQNGDGSTDNVTPVHTVTLTGFYIGKYEVTQEQYQAVMGINPSHFTTNADAGEVQEKRPVDHVSWYSALVFCNKLSISEGLSPAYSISGSTDPIAWGTVPTSNNATWNGVAIVAGSNGYRLPTEAQWEYAAKGGPSASNPYKIYSGSDNANDVTWVDSGKTHEVGKKAPNELGIYDMSGNMYEWCWDRYGSYTSETQTNPVGASSGSSRVARGGYYIIISFLRSVYRNNNDPFGMVFANGEPLGFRVVRP